MLVKFHIFIFYNIHDSGISLENSIYSLLKLLIEKNIAYITCLRYSINECMHYLQQEVVHSNTDFFSPKT